MELVGLSSEWNSVSHGHSRHRGDVGRDFGQRARAVQLTTGTVGGVCFLQKRNKNALHNLSAHPPPATVLRASQSLSSPLR